MREVALETIDWFGPTQMCVQSVQGDQESLRSTALRESTVFSIFWESPDENFLGY